MKRLPELCLNRFVWVMVICGLLLTISPVQAQSGIQANIGSTVTNFHVGDVVGVIVQVTHPAGYRVIAPELDAMWGDLEVRDVVVLSIDSAENNNELTTLQINVTAWEPGVYNTPPLPLKIALQDGNLSAIELGSIALTVDSVLSPEDLNLRDIKDQASVPFPSRLPLYAALGAAAVALFALLLLWIWRRRKLAPDFEEQVIIEDLRPANVIALETLSEIERRDLAGQGLYKDHYTLISDTLRRYLEKAFKIPAMEATTYEIRSSLRRESGLDVVQRTQLERILQESDLVKFARVKPSVEQAKQLPRLARDFVQSSYGLSAEKIQAETFDDAPAQQEEEPVA